MRFLRSTMLLAVTGALTACSTDAVTGAVSPRTPSATPGAPAFALLGSTPAPQIVSATLLDKSTVRITFSDNAADESMVSAYFTPDASYNGAVTENIAGSPSVGERSVDVTLPAGSTTVRLRNGWSTSSVSSGIVWSSFSNAVTISSTVAPTGTAKAKGRK